MANDKQQRQIHEKWLIAAFVFIGAGPIHSLPCHSSTDSNQNVQRSLRTGDQQPCHTW